MQNNEYRRIIAITEANRKRWLKVNSALTENSGIYFIYRQEDGIKYGYVGQAKHILTRLAEHLMSYLLHIEISLKKHGLYSADNECGYKVVAVECEETELNEKEREYIQKAAQLGYQLRNKTLGGQDKGKKGINENKPTKGYRDGLAQGYKNARREISKLFEKNLLVSINGKITANKEKALAKFQEFITLDYTDN